MSHCLDCLNAYVKSHKFVGIHSDTFIEWNYLNRIIGPEKKRKRELEKCDAGWAGSGMEKRDTVLPVDLKRWHHQNHNYFPLAIDHWYTCAGPFRKYHIGFACPSRIRKLTVFRLDVVFHATNENEKVSYTFIDVCVLATACVYYVCVHWALYTNFQSMHFYHAIPQKVFIGLVSELCDYVIYDSIHPFNGTIRQHQQNILLSR